MVDGKKGLGVHGKGKRQEYRQEKSCSQYFTVFTRLGTILSPTLENDQKSFLVINEGRPFI